VIRGKAPIERVTEMEIQAVHGDITTEATDVVVNAANQYRRALEVADEHGAVSIAFPAISTGIYGFPADDAAEIAVNTIRATPTSIELVRLVAFDAETFRRYRRLLGNEA
jgi:O-acetyl-ADP-ribose deacetylase (regulator of RNase III)